MDIRNEIRGGVLCGQPGHNPLTKSRWEASVCLHPPDVHFITGDTLSYSLLESQPAEHHRHSINASIINKTENESY